MPCFRLAPGSENPQQYTLELRRPVKPGEHVRFSFFARLVDGAKISFGLGGSAEKPTTSAITIRSDGKIAYSDGAQEMPIEGLSNQLGEWKNYSFDYVVGSDQILITAGTDQFTADAPFSSLPGPLDTIDRIFISSGPKSGTGEFSRLEASVIMEESVLALPVFGKIRWSRHEIPLIQLGPRGGISGFGFVAAGGRLFLIGGYIPAGDDTLDQGNRTSKWVLSYDPTAGTWTRCPDLPDRREYGSAVALGDQIFYFGGAKQDPYIPVADVFSLDISKPGAAWKSLPPLSVARSHSAGAVIDNQLIVVGGNEYNADVKGYGPSTIRDTVEALDLGAVDRGWRQLSPMPAPARGWSAFATLGTKLYLFGGMTFLPKGTGRINQRLQSSMAYSPETDSWESLSPPPFAVSAARAAVYGDRYIVLFGGTYASPQDRIYRWNAQSFVYDTRDDKWFRFESSATPPGGVYNDPGMAIIGNKIYIAGGEAIHAHYNSLTIGEIEQLPRPGESARTK